MSSIKDLIYIILFTMVVFESFCRNTENNFITFTDDEEITTITSDNEDELMDAIDQLNNNGGTIYIDTPIITLRKNTDIALDNKTPGGIIGIRQKTGEYPRFIFTIKNELYSGFNIYGSNKFMEYVIIENSSEHGITIMGDNNILDHVISRYNYGSGFAVFGDFNTLNYCYSYRNYVTKPNFLSADGFYIFGEVNNIFNYCFAWDNANSGFNYARNWNSSELSYLHSGSWNNGNINVFTGRYDYDNGSPLDKNLWTIKEIMNSDPNFVSNYYNKKFNIDNAYINGENVKQWSAKMIPLMDGNGFTFGNKNSSQSIDVKRNALYCVAFDHKSGGFIDNFNHKYNAYITNCASFNNNKNYNLPYYTFSKWTDNWSWDSKNPDNLNKVTAKKPSNSNTIQNIFNSVTNQIIKAVSANMFPDGINFDNGLSRIRE